MTIRSFWKIYHAIKIFLENLPFNANISMEIDTNGKFPCLYGYAYRDNPESVKIAHIFNGHGGQLVRAVACYA
jgi:hypothetical protein